MICQTIQDISLTPKDIAYYLGVSHEIVCHWCAKGKLCGVQNRKKASWKISGVDFAEFLYQNPGYQLIFERNKLGAFGSQIRETILQRVYQHPDKLYRLEELASIFGVNINTVRVWIVNGRLKAIDIPTSLSKRLVRSSDLYQFLEKNPGYEKRYEEAILALEYERDFGLKRQFWKVKKE